MEELLYTAEPTKNYTTLILLISSIIGLLIFLYLVQNKKIKAIKDTYRQISLLLGGLLALIAFTTSIFTVWNLQTIQPVKLYETYMESYNGLTPYKQIKRAGIFNHLGEERVPGSIGRPVWGVEVKLVDDDGNDVPTGEKGELWYRGHNVMKGYYKRPDANAKTITNGWLHSGDVAVKDEKGRYYIVDRTKDMIIRGGLNVYPREVEEVMIKHEAVSLVAVTGIPDPKMGEEIKAYVVLADSASATPSELIAYTKANLAAYKYPRQVEIIDALPMSATGKILKKELRKMEAEKSKEPQDLTKIEGIGPKIAEVLNAAGISNYGQLAGTDKARVKEILSEAGGKFAIHDSSTWSDQAQLAAEGKWEQLQKWQDILDGGKEVA